MKLIALKSIVIKKFTLTIITIINVTIATKNVSYTDSDVTCSTTREGDDEKKSISNYSVLYEYLTGTGAHNFSESVTIGFLGAYRQAQVMLGALPLAIEAVNEDASKY